jgi:transposase-like protein
MNIAERKKKFNEYVRISQEGNLSATETARKPGISINTLYNWRKRLLIESHQIQKTIQSVPPFSRIEFEPQHPRAAQSFIEITIANTLVMRIPSNVPDVTLHAILDHCAIRG